jgi:hypothetical protein
MPRNKADKLLFIANSFPSYTNKHNQKSHATKAPRHQGKTKAQGKTQNLFAAKFTQKRFSW